MENKNIKDFFEIVSDYLETNKEPNKEVIKYLRPEVLKDTVDFDIKPNGESIEDVLGFIKNYLTYNVKTDSKQFFNQLYGGNNMPAFFGEVVTTITNTSAYTYEVAPLAMIIEKMLIKKMCNLVGFENGDGTFGTGGSNSNMIAMLSARNRLEQDVKNKGMYQLPALRAYVSDQAHYSHETAANLLGIGKHNLIKVKSDANGKMIPEELEKEILKAKEEGAMPFYVAATAATTLLAAVDPIPEIAQIAKKYDMWFHIDAAFGGSFLLSSKHRKLLNGSHLADSFAWNPHKLMNVPLVCSTFLVKEDNRLQLNLTDLNTDYLFHDNEGGCDLGTKSLQCGRKVDSLKLFTAWKFHGDKGYENRINKLFEIAEYFENKVKQHPKLQLQANRQTLTICYRYIPEADTNIGQFNINLRENLRRNGKSLVNYGYIGDEVTIRFINVNPEVSTADIDKFFDYMFEEAEAMEKELQMAN